MLSIADHPDTAAAEPAAAELAAMQQIADALDPLRHNVHQVRRVLAWAVARYLIEPARQRLESITGANRA